MDHCCWRVETDKEYKLNYDYLLELGSLLVEDMIGGRMISTFKLHVPVDLGNGKSVQLIELPMPKENRHYATGWEHCEFVVGLDVDLLKFTQRYPHLKWDLSGLEKDFNSDVRIELNDVICCKFHHLSLETVIEIEKTSLKK
jgi:predicted metalloenzyme YecM